VKPNAKVLDLGCGDGTLLKYLKEARNALGYGIEIADANILACVEKNINVIQMDLEAGLSGFEPQSFDFVILSQTLQAMHNIELVVKEILRVGRQGIVTIPNFGYWRRRIQIIAGRMPVSRICPTSGTTRPTSISAPSLISRRSAATTAYASSSAMSCAMAGREFSAESAGEFSGLSLRKSLTDRNERPSRLPPLRLRERIEVREIRERERVRTASFAL